MKIEPGIYLVSLLPGVPHAPGFTTPIIIFEDEHSTKTDPVFRAQFICRDNKIHELKFEHFTHLRKIVILDSWDFPDTRKLAEWLRNPVTLLTSMEGLSKDLHKLANIFDSPELQFNEVEKFRLSLLETFKIAQAEEINVGIEKAIEILVQL